MMRNRAVVFDGHFEVAHDLLLVELHDLHELFRRLLSLGLDLAPVDELTRFGAQCFHDLRGELHFLVAQALTLQEELMQAMQELIDGQCVQLRVIT